jgi:O-antigen/teichoic acid export membrane protein
LFQSSHYSIASLLTLIGGLVTFPVLTRLFSVADYGLMSLMSATLAISVAIGKTGVQHSIVRYFSEISAGKGRFTLPQLYSTAVLGMAASALVVMMALLIGGRVAPDAWMEDQRLRGLLAIVSILVVIEVLDSSITNFLRADQRSMLLMKYQIAKKYLSLGCLLFAVLVIAPTLTMFYWASVFAETCAFALLVWLLFAARRDVWPRPQQFSLSLYRQLLAFGIPMVVGYEISGLILNVGDRYIVRAMIGEKELGLYSAAYNLCQYVQSVFTSSVNQAIMPLYMRMWDEEGREKTSAFVSRALRDFILLSAPVIAGVASVGPELLPSLASEKYAGAGHVLPWVISGMIVDGVASFVGAGLFVHRKTRTIMAAVSVSAIANIGMNLVLVPRFGIGGAAAATLASYSITCLVFGWAGKSLLPVRLPWGTILRASLAALVMFAVLHYLYPGRRFLAVGVRVLVGAPLYVCTVSLIDRDARALARLVGRRLWLRLGGSSAAR